MLVTVHGDDFTATGPAHGLEHFANILEAKYEIKKDMLGPKTAQGEISGCACSQEVRVLNRVLRWEATGIDYEPDQRHAEVIVRELGLENAKSLTSPWSAEELKEGDDADTEPLAGEEATRYRAVTARLNYLALDRPDIQYATKEVSKKMSNPRKTDWRGLKRIGRYLLGALRLVQHFTWQSPQYCINTYTDSDWAGDKKSAKSTSGGAVTLGEHTHTEDLGVQPECHRHV